MNNIALLCGYLNIGGAEKLIVDLAENIKNENKSIVVITIKGGGKLEEYIKKKDIKLYNLNSKNKFSMKTLKKLIKIFKDEKIKIAHSHSFNAHLYCVLAKLFCNIDHIHTEHNIIENKKFYQKMIDKILVRYTDRIVACSEYVYDNLKKYYSNEKLSFVNNGINVEKFKYNPQLRERFRKTLNLDYDDFLMVTVAMLRPQKNHLEFLEVVKMIIQKDKKVKWLIVGDGPCKEDIRDYIRSHGLEKNIIMYGSNNNINDILNGSDIFILPSKYEGLPLSILESMSCGLPVIATNVGGVGQVVIDKVNGYKVNKNNLDNFIDIILSLKQNKLYLEKLKKSCRNFIINNYSIDKCYNNYKEIYFNLER